MGAEQWGIIYSKNIKHLPCARHCSECGGTAMNKTDKNSVFKGMTFSWEVVRAVEMKQVRGGSRAETWRRQGSEPHRYWGGNFVLNVKVVCLLFNKLFCPRGHECIVPEGEQG